MSNIKLRVLFLKYFKYEFVTTLNEILNSNFISISQILHVELNFDYYLLMVRLIPSLLTFGFRPFFEIIILLQLLFLTQVSCHLRHYVFLYYYEKNILLKKKKKKKIELPSSWSTASQFFTVNRSRLLLSIVANLREHSITLNNGANLFQSRSDCDSTKFQPPTCSKPRSRHKR